MTPFRSLTALRAPAVSEVLGERTIVVQPLGALSRHPPEHPAANRHVRFVGPVSSGWLADDFNDEGCIGDPRPADADQGKFLFEDAVDSLCEALREISAFEFRG